MPRTKEEKKAYLKEYYAKEENKAKAIIRSREWYHKNKELIKESKNAKERERYHKNKEKEALRNKEYRANNKEKVALASKTYYDNNKEKARIQQWKRRGIIDDDFTSLNEVFKQQTHCWICLEEYSNKIRKCLDHDWEITDDGNVRYICCHICNTTVVG